MSRGRHEKRPTCTYRSEAHLISGIVSHVEVECGIQGVDWDFLTSKDERHIDLLVTRHFPDTSNVRSIGELCTRDATVHSIGQGPGYLISIANLAGCVCRLLGDLTH